MSEFRKFMSYIYCYQRTAKIKNTGFAKIAARDEELSMQISIRGMQLFPFGTGKVYVCVQKGNLLQGICVGDMVFNGGMGVLNITTKRDNIMGEQVTLEEVCGLYIKIKEDKSVYMASAWNNVQMQYLEFVEGIKKDNNQKENNVENITEDKLTQNTSNGIEVVEKESETKTGELQLEQNSKGAQQKVVREEEEKIYENNIDSANHIIEIKQVTDMEFQENEEEENVVLLREEPQEDLNVQCVCGGEAGETVDNCEKKESSCEKHTWNDWLCHFKNIHPFECSGKVEVIRMEPKDIGRLPKECWGLANNSFLLHGYCNYRYLILYKNLDCEKFNLGVPGMYHPREKMIAGMFGFGEFVMARKAPVRQGEFGYYVREVCL